MGERATSAGVHALLTVPLCGQPQVRLEVCQCSFFIHMRCRKDFESTRAFAQGLNAVLVDQDKGLQLAVRQDMCQKVLAFAQGLGCDQSTPASQAL